MFDDLRLFSINAFGGVPEKRRKVVVVVVPEFWPGALNQCWHSWVYTTTVDHRCVLMRLKEAQQVLVHVFDFKPQ